VASIKPSKTDGFGMRTMIGGGANGRFSSSNLTVRQLILQAYGLQDFQVTGGQGWIATERFDIEATPPAGATMSQAQMQQMLQSLLEDRFQLKVRRETKPMAAYSLVVAKGGVKMKVSTDQTPLGTGPQTGVSGTGTPRGMIRMAPGNLSAQAVAMSGLGRMLSGQLGRTVLDNTGLTGLFDVELNWTPDRIPPQGPTPGLELPPVDPGGPTLFTAVQEQLGLRLETTTQLGEMLTIVSIEKPSEN
jgi:uncharacterized protein (TIGR03435 family)